MHNQEAFRQNSKSWLIRLSFWFAAVILAFGAVWSGYNLYHAVSRHQPASTSSNDLSPCGMDPKKARFAGCLFDPIALSWVPQECYDFDLAKEFLELAVPSGWQFWQESGKESKALSLANVMQRQDMVLYVSRRYLRERCVFGWRKMHRAVMRGREVDGYVLDWDGIVGCEEVWKGRKEDRDGLVRVEVGFPSCGRYF